MKLDVKMYTEGYLTFSLIKWHALYKEPYQVRGTLQRFYGWFVDTGRLFPYMHFYSVGGNDEQGHPVAPTVQTLYIWGTVTTPRMGDFGGGEQNGEEQLEGGKRHRPRSPRRRSRHRRSPHHRRRY